MDIILNAVSIGGLILAKHLASAYENQPQVRAIVVGGSVSYGYADNYSDLEIGIFWADAPQDDDRKSIIEQLGGDLWTFNPYQTDPEWLAAEHYGLREITIGDEVYAGTAMIDVKHFTVSGMDQLLHAVIDEYDTSIEKQVVIAAVQYGVSLYGHDLIKNWQSKATTFPDALAIKIIQENLWFSPWFPTEGYTARDDVIVLYQHFIWAQQCVLRVLSALNRFYYHSREHKWMDPLIDRLEIAPADLSTRMKQVFKLPSVEGWQVLKSIIDDTIALIETHLPEVNTLALFEEHPEINATWARQRWQPEAPYTLMQELGMRNL
jgi:hypothetical protein